MGAYDPQGRATIESFVEIMRYLGTSFGVLRKEHCTGDPVRRLGHDALVTELAEANLKLLRQSSVTKIVSICPHCVRTMAEDWNQLRAPVPGQEALPFDATIEHHSEFLARYADHLPVLENGPKVAFHDPCYLGRYRGVYDDPRTVLARTARLVEAPRTREKSFCCGAGGGLVFLGEETGQRISHERADELLATNADVVATACPFCTAVFREAVADAPGDEQAVQFLDIAQIVERQIRS
jgi:Fe-S oxidoreductase